MVAILALGVLFYNAACFLRWFAQDQRAASVPNPTICPACGYSLAGLPSSPTCPECDHVSDAA